MIALIAAYASNRVIGAGGKIPWHIKGEQPRFKDLTTGNVVILGRHSFAEIGKPLPGRETIVISTSQTYTGENCRTCRSLPEALALCREKDVYISGGAGLYEEAIGLVDKMYITEIDLVPEGDTYFPDFNKELFVRQVEKEVQGRIPYKYVTYVSIEKLIECLYSKDHNRAHQCLLTLERESARSDKVYHWFDRFSEMSKGQATYIRIRGLRLIAANARWDKDNKIDEIIDGCLKHIVDVKPIAARQFIAVLPEIARYKVELRSDIIRALQNADIGKYNQNMQPLVYKDILAALAQIERG